MLLKSSKLDLSSTGMFKPRFMMTCSKRKVPGAAFAVGFLLPELCSIPFISHATQRLFLAF